MNALAQAPALPVCTRCDRPSWSALDSNGECKSCNLADMREVEHAKKYRARKKVAKPEAPDWDPSENVDPLHGYRGDWLDVSRLAPAPKRVPTEGTGPGCKCGITHTLGSFRACPLISATDRTEGFTAIHDEQRKCACGAVLMHTTKRLLGDKR